MGRNRLVLSELCQRYVDEQWVAAHMTDEQAAESLLDQFKRAVMAELELLTVEARRTVGYRDESRRELAVHQARRTMWHGPFA